MLITIYLKELLDPISFSNGGSNLYEKIYSPIKSGDSVNLVMDDVPPLPTIFMNMSFGQLIRMLGKQRVMQALRFTNISKSQLERFKNYFKSFETPENATQAL